MKRIVIYRSGSYIIKVFGSIAKAHGFAIASNLPVPNLFSEFKKKMEQDWGYTMPDEYDGKYFELHEVE